MQLLKL